MKFNKSNILFIAIIFIAALIITTIITNIVVAEHPSKERIISTFKKNSTRFNKIAKYINEMDGFFSFFYDYDRKRYISINRLGDYEQEIVIDSNIQTDFIYLMEKLNFQYITEGKDYILFIQKHSHYEQGIVYTNNNISGELNDVIYIEDNWHYYDQTYE